MDTEKLRILLRVAESGSFTRTAEELGYTQSAVSHAVQAVEQELGLRLIERGKRTSTPTAAARELLPWIRELVRRENGLRETAAQLTGLVTGEVRVGCFSGIALYLLPELLEAFRKAYPGVRQELICGRYSEGAEWLEQDRVDCAFLTLPAGGRVETYLLRRDRYDAILPAGHPLCGRTG